jgi:hypothetical protein
LKPLLEREAARAKFGAKPLGWGAWLVCSILVAVAGWSINPPRGVVDAAFLLGGAALGGLIIAGLIEAVRQSGWK